MWEPDWAPGPVCPVCGQTFAEGELLDDQEVGALVLPAHDR